MLISFFNEKRPLLKNKGDIEMKYYYELQWPVSACWTPKNCEHMTEKELIKDATARINDYLSQPRANKFARL